MPLFDQTGPRGFGPRTGRIRGPCRSFGQELVPPGPSPIVQSERSPTAQEISMWRRAEESKQRTVLWAYINRLQFENIVRSYTFASKNGIDLNEPELPDLESRMLAALNEIDKLRLMHCEVNGLRLAVYPTAGGQDLDIVSPSPVQSLSGIWIPIAIGAIIVGGIIARWAHLEKEVQVISDKYNGVLRRADLNLCADPTSSMCHNWKAQKQSGGYVKNETLIDSVKSAVTRVGSFAARGLGVGIMLAIPILLLLYLPKKRFSGKD